MKIGTLFLARRHWREFRQQPLDCGFVRCEIFALIHRQDQNDEHVFLYGVDEPISLLAKLDLVAVCQPAAQPAAWNVRVSRLRN